MMRQMFIATLKWTFRRTLSIQLLVLFHLLQNEIPKFSPNVKWTEIDSERFSNIKLQALKAPALKMSMGQIHLSLKPT